MPQAIDRLFATPRIRPRLPRIRAEVSGMIVPAAPPPLVSRFQRSHHIAARSGANVGSKGTLARPPMTQGGGPHKQPLFAACFAQPGVSRGANKRNIAGVKVFV